MSSAGFLLQEWETNSPSLEAVIDRASDGKFDDVTGLLGMRWVKPLIRRSYYETIDFKHISESF